MKDIDRINKRLERLTLPVRRLNKQLDKISKNIKPPAFDLPNIKAPKVNIPKIDLPNIPTSYVSNAIDNIAASFAPLFELNETAKRLVKAAENWQISRKEDVYKMADNGWYPNWYTFYHSAGENQGTLDDFMANHLNDDWDNIRANIIQLCPNRTHILDNAFKLHKTGNYIASIPLFLSQADGICCESLKSFLFTGNDTEQNIKKLIESGEIETTMLTEIFLEPFSLKNHHNSGISKSSEKAKNKAPNRNGILHGHRKHLDYGTELNSLKCFSLLSFIVYSVKEIITNEEIIQLGNIR